MLIRLGTLRRWLQEAKGVNHQDPGKMVASLEASKPGSPQRKNLVYFLLVHGAWFKPEDKPLQDLFQEIADIFGVEIDELLEFRKKFKQWKQQNQSTSYSTGSMDPEMKKFVDKNEMLMKPVVKKLETIDMTGLSDKLLTRMAKRALEIDWRPTETVPEDYYAL